MPIGVNITSTSQVSVTQAVANPVGVPGSPGQGLNPEGQWVTGRNYQYLDVVYNNGVSYVCKFAHASSAPREPGVGGTWESQWEPLSASPLNDESASTTTTYSSNKITSDLATKANTTHTHAASDIASGTLADARIAESNVTQHQNAIDHDQLTNYDAAQHRVINDAGTGNTDLFSAQRIISLAGAKADTAHTHAATDVISGVFDAARISQESVTQHQAALDHGSIAGLGDNDHTIYITTSIASNMFTVPSSDFGVPPQNSIEGANEGHGLLKLTKNLTSTSLPTNQALEIFPLYNGSSLIGGWINSNGAAVGSGDHNVASPNGNYWYWNSISVIGPDGELWLEDIGKIRFYEQASQGDFYLTVRAPESLDANYEYVLPKKAPEDHALLTHATSGVDNGKMRWEEKAGTTFPTDNLYTGRSYYRTDLKEQFYYDADRSKWLGDMVMLSFAYSADYTSSNYIRYSGGPFGPDGGPLIHNDMTLVAMSRSDTDGGWVGDFNLRNNSTDIATGLIASDGSEEASDSTLNVDIAAGTVLTLNFNRTSGTLGAPAILVYLRRHAT